MRERRRERGTVGVTEREGEESGSGEGKRLILSVWCEERKARWQRSK